MNPNIAQKNPEIKQKLKKVDVGQEKRVQLDKNTAKKNGLIYNQTINFITETASKKLNYV